jgi:lipoate-protein ligase B
VRDLGCVPYAEGLALQEEIVAARRRGACPDTLLLLEHPPVVTLGRSARPENLLFPRAELAARGIAVHEVARGGDVTYHAPGQLVGYPIVDLDARGARDVHAWLRTLETVVGEVLAGFGVPWHRVAGRTGVFVDGGDAPGPARKIASIGVGVRGWVTCHGFALNVDLDLAGFEVIVPCGLHDVEMTSIAREIGAPASGRLGARARALARSAFEAALGQEPDAQRGEAERRRPLHG